MIIPHPFTRRTLTPGATGTEAHLRIMATTDLHVHVLPYDYYADRPVDSFGLARTASLIRIARAEAENTLLVDNGDFLQGNPMGDYIAHARGMTPGDRHPIITAMNHLGYDGATLGNHEFNYGLEFLMNTLAGADFPVVSANIATRQGAGPRGDQTLLPPYVLLDRLVLDASGARQPIRIGLIGLAPPQIMLWDRKHLEGNVWTRDILEAATAFVPQMKEAGADLIIALSHSGIGAAKAALGMENASTALARIEGIDALVTGHSHQVFPSPSFSGLADVDAKAGTISGKPAVMAGFWGSHLGLIDLLLQREGGKWRVLAAASEARPIACREAGHRSSALVESDAAVTAAVQMDHLETLTYMGQPLGKTTVPLHSYFALVADSASIKIVTTAQRWHVAQMLQGSAHAHLPILSAAAPFKAGGRGGPEYYTHVPAGDLAIRNLADLYFFPNAIRALRVTGSEVKDWLERSAGIYNQITPGLADQTLLDPDFPSYNFDVIHGVTYRIDLSQPAKFGARGEVLSPGAGRIIDLAFNGAPLDPTAEFVIATNSYRASGRLDFPGTALCNLIYESRETNRDIVVRFVMERGVISPQAAADWGFAPLPGTSVLFDTGAKAADYLADLADLRIEPAGDGPNGFARFRIDL